MQRTACLSEIATRPSERWLHEIPPEVVIDADCLSPLRKVNSVVGEGTFAIVEQCKYRAPGSKDNQVVAVKRLRKERLASDNDVRLFLREASVLRQLKSRHIVQYIGTGGERGSPATPLPASSLSSFNGSVASSVPQASGLFLVQELMDGGSLRRKVQRTMSGNDDYSPTDALRWSLQIARGIQYLHNSKPMVIHRDLKLDNILLKGKTSATAEAKIADFGLSALVPVVGRGRPYSHSSGCSVRRTDVSSLRGTRSFVAGNNLSFRTSSSMSSTHLSSPYTAARLQLTLPDTASPEAASQGPISSPMPAASHPGPQAPVSRNRSLGVGEREASWSRAVASFSRHAVPGRQASEATLSGGLAGPSNRPASETLKGAAPAGPLRPSPESLRMAGAPPRPVFEGPAPPPPPARRVSETFRGLLALPSARLGSMTTPASGRSVSAAQITLPVQTEQTLSSEEVSGEGEPVAPLPGACIDGSLCTSMGMSMFSGMSVLSDSVNHLSGRTGSYMYMAPEMYKCESYDASVDVFSFGMILYELFGRVLLIYNIVWMGKPAENKLYAQRVSQGYRPPLVSSAFKGDLGQLISDCWAQDPALRPTMNEVVDRLVDIEAAGALKDIKHCGCRVS